MKQYVTAGAGLSVRRIAAMDINDDAPHQAARVFLAFFASRLAPTKGRAV
jgi:hypothetical protein